MSWRPAVGWLLAATLLSTAAGCGSGLVGPGAPSPTRSTLYGERESGVLTEGWLLVTQKKISCDDVTSAIDGDADTGEAILIALERGTLLDVEGLYPGTFSSVDGAQGRHCEVYFERNGDRTVLTGNDVWVEVLDTTGGIVQVELSSGPAEGLVVADHCDAI